MVRGSGSDPLQAANAVALTEPVDIASKRPRLGREFDPATSQKQQARGESGIGKREEIAPEVFATALKFPLEAEKGSIQFVLGAPKSVRIAVLFLDILGQVISCR